MSAGSHWSRVGLPVLLAAVGVISFVRAVRLDYDFHHFYRDGRYVWEHGRLNPDLDGPDRLARRQLRFYLPVVPLLLAPLTSGGLWPTAAVWCLAQVGCVAYSLRVLRRWGATSEPEAGSRWVLALATLLALPAVYEAARFNQLSFFVLALVLAALSALGAGRPVRAGVWLGLATVLKLLPGLLVVWLLLKRQWTALGVCLLVTSALAFGPTLLIFGPRQTADYHRQWWHDNVGNVAVRGLTDPALRSHFIDHRNQSLAAVVARLCWPEHPAALPYQPLELSEAGCRRVAWVLTLALSAGLIWLTRRRLPATGEGGRRIQRLRSEGAAYLIAMVVFSPLLRTYYYIWALPALVLLVRALRVNAAGERGPARVGIAVWLAGMLGWLSDTLRAGGVHLVMLIVLGAIVLRLGARVGANDATVSGTPDTRCAPRTRTSCSSPC